MIMISYYQPIKIYFFKQPRTGKIRKSLAIDKGSIYHKVVQIEIIKTKIMFGKDLKVCGSLLYLLQITVLLSH